MSKIKNENINLGNVPLGTIHIGYLQAVPASYLPLITIKYTIIVEASLVNSKYLRINIYFAVFKSTTRCIEHALSNQTVFSDIPLLGWSNYIYFTCSWL